MKIELTEKEIRFIKKGISQYFLKGYNMAKNARNIDVKVASSLNEKLNQVNENAKD